MLKDSHVKYFWNQTCCLCCHARDLFQGFKWISGCSQNGRRVPGTKLRSDGLKLRAFQNEVWVGVPKFPAKICIEAIFQLSARVSILSFCRYGACCCCLNSIQHVTQDLRRRQEKNKIGYSIKYPHTPHGRQCKSCKKCSVTMHRNPQISPKFCKF